LNPAGQPLAAQPAGVAAPDVASGQGTGPAPGPAVVIENAGMAPKDLRNTLVSEFNARTRTTKT
jgi:hypothetical protein